MKSALKKTTLGLALIGALILAACGSNGSDLGPANNPANQPVALSALIRSLVTISTNDTALPMEINALLIDASSEDPADPNYAAVIGA